MFCALGVRPTLFANVFTTSVTAVFSGPLPQKVKVSVLASL
jgi:hypothetical protein